MFVNEICCKEWNTLKLPSTAGNGNILMQNHCHCEGETAAHYFLGQYNFEFRSESPASPQFTGL